MIVFAPAQRADMESRAAAALAARRSASVAPIRPPRARNLPAVMLLDQSTYFAFRGRPFGVPPLPWAVGERLMEIYARAGAAADRMRRAVVDREDAGHAMREYFAAVGEFPDILWAHCRPVARRWRLARALGLMKNPFRTASDRELMEIADFFCTRRMKSGAQFPTPATIGHRPRATSLTTS